MPEKRVTPSPARAPRSRDGRGRRNRLELDRQPAECDKLLPWCTLESDAYSPGVRFGSGFLPSPSLYPKPINLPWPRLRRKPLAADRPTLADSAVPSCGPDCVPPSAER